MHRFSASRGLGDRLELAVDSDRGLRLLRVRARRWVRIGWMRMNRTPPAAVGNIFEAFPPIRINIRLETCAFCRGWSQSQKKVLESPHDRNDRWY